MNLAFVKGMSFGLTSSIMTVLGLIVGLYAFSGSKMVIIGSILTIAIADSLADALGIHISEESAKKKDEHVWTSTFATFISKFLCSALFIIPVWFLDSTAAIIASVAWGFLLLILLSYFIATDQKKSPAKAITEHLVIGIIIIIVTHYVGIWIRLFFG